jgi:hypothetical protein
MVRHCWLVVMPARHTVWPGPGLGVVVGGHGPVADETQCECVWAEVDESVIGAAGAGRVDDAGNENACGAAAVVADWFAVGAVAGGDRVGVLVGAGVGVGVVHTVGVSMRSPGLTVISAAAAGAGWAIAAAPIARRVAAAANFTPHLRGGACQGRR